MTALRKLVILLVLAVIAGVVLWNLDYAHRETPEEACSPLVHSKTETAANVATSVGDIIHQWKRDATAWTAEQIQQYLTGASVVWRVIAFGLKDSIKEGKVKADQAVTGMVPPVIDCSKVCLNAGEDQDQGNAPGSGEYPLDAISVGGSGKAMVAAAAARYFPAAQVPMAVAVAQKESSYNPRAVLNYRGARMLGLWQINDRAHPDLVQGRDWTNPVVNAWMAYQVWKDAGGSWSPWTTASSARAALAANPAAYSTIPQPSVPDAGPQVPGDPINPQVNPSQPQAQACVAGSGVRVGTWNIYHSNDDVNVVAGMAALSGQADVIGGQEFNAGRYFDAAKTALPGWQVIGEDTPQPIFVNTAHLSVVGSGKERAWPGSTPAGLPTRWVNWVTLRAASGGQVFSVVNTHLLAQIEKGGQLDTRGAPGRTRLAVTQLRTIGSVTGRLRSRGPVMVTGDFNAVPSNTTVAGLMAKAGLSPNWATLGRVQTHGTRTIDYVWSTMTPGAQSVLAKYGSDHSPVVVTFPANQSAVNAPSGPAPSSWQSIRNPRTPEQAIAQMTALVGSRIPSGRCLHYVAAAYGHSTTAPTNGHWYAIDTYNTMPEQFRGTGDPPRGALVFWRTGSAAGHIALSLGDGRVVTTDYPRSGTIGIAPISDIDRWGTRVGWTAPYFRQRSTITGGI